jgi:hypothetical protein
MARAPLLLLAALLACAGYAAFADGATDLPAETWLQLVLVVLSVVVVATLLYGRSLRVAASPLAWAGLGLLAAFCVWTALTITWSVAPDRSWEQFNRALAYVLAIGLGMVVGSSLSRAPERAAKGWVAVAALVAAYALAGKTVPGILGLDHAGFVARLREPIGYWNALALICALAVAPALRLAADPAQREWTRLSGLFALYTFFVVIGLTYSRGGVLGAIAALIVVLAFAPQPLRSFGLVVLAGLAAMTALVTGFNASDLTTNAVPLAQREGDALLALAIFLACGAVLLIAGRFALRVAERVPRERARRVGRTVLALGVGLLALGLVPAVLAGGVGDLARDFTDERSADAVTDPSRVNSTSSSNRWSWWNEAAGAWSDKPLHGWGAGSFPVTHRMYRKDQLGVLQPHNVPLQWLAETGLVGLVLALGGFLALIAAALSRARRGAGGYGVAAGAAGVAWLFHATFDWDWDIPGVTLPVCVLLGVAAARPVAREAASFEARGAALAVATVLGVAALVSASLPALAERETESALRAGGDPKASEADLRDASASAELAARLNPLAAEPLYAAASIDERRASYPAARRTLLRALEREPDDVDGWYRLARIEATLRDAGGLRRAAERALELDPFGQVARLLAVQAVGALLPPDRSATATGAPLPELVPLTDPRPPLDGSATPTPTPTPAPSPAPTPSP